MTADDRESTAEISASTRYPADEVRIWARAFDSFEPLRGQDSLSPPTHLGRTEFDLVREALLFPGIRETVERLTSLRSTRDRGTLTSDLADLVLTGPRPAAVRSVAGTIRARSRDIPSSVLAMTYEHEAIGLLLGGDSPQALMQLTAAQRSAIGASPNLARRGQVLSSSVHSLRGNLREASRFLDWSTAHPSVAMFATDRQFDAWLDLARAQISVESAAVVTQATPLQLPPLETAGALWPIVMLTRAREALLAGSPLRALETAEYALDCHPVDSELASEALLWTMQYALAELDEGSREPDSRIGAHGSGGSLARLGCSRRQLQNGNATAARDLTRSVLRRPGVPMAVRGEALLLRLWADVLTYGHIDPSSAAQAARLATHSKLLRLFALIPGWLRDEIGRRLGDDGREAYRELVEPLPDRPRRTPLREIQLTPKERQVLAALFRYDTIAQIAAAMFVTSGTVKSQLSSIYRKLGVRSRDEAMAFAVRDGLLNDHL